ncbi:MAG: class I SAM-dependent methyltransferase [Flavobacteriales bacterium]
MNKNTPEWFKTWFDSPYYSILYKNRSEEEAADFIDRLTLFLSLKRHSSVLDLACGKGRHSIHLRSLGYDVVGVDLSVNSIEEAKKNEKPGLHFETADMRNFKLGTSFDAIFNLFTSFGYFDKVEDNVKVLENVHKHLKPEGWFVIDYFNSSKVKNELISSQEKTIEGVKFLIEKKLEGGFIKKSIQFSDKGKDYHFEERVQLIEPETLIEWLKSQGFQIVHTFGSYFLDEFDQNESDRFITISRKR